MVTVLRDLGERRIVSEILPEYVTGVGSDCALIDIGAVQIVATTDPVPQPAAVVIGGDPDLYWMGWLLVVINASDLAASGASPLAFLSAIEAPPDLPVDDFRRLLTGIQECCHAEGLKYVGGNLREAPRVGAVGTAIGLSPQSGAITRWGAHPDHILVSVGAGGRFWRDALVVRGGGRVEKDTSPLFRPRSQLSVMQLLCASNLVRAAIDNSDGLLPTLYQLASANSLQVILDMDQLIIPDQLGSRSEVSYQARLWLGWGDWNVIAALRESDVAEAQRLAYQAGGMLTPIGRFAQGNPEVLLRRGIRVSSAPRLESERFATDSWFSAGIDAYVDQLMTIPLP